MIDLIKFTKVNEFNIFTTIENLPEKVEAANLLTKNVQIRNVKRFRCPPTPIEGVEFLN